MKQKKCGTCSKTKPISMFHRKLNRHNSNCKPCQREHMRKNYNKNRKRYIDHSRKSNAATREFFRNLKDNKPCDDCKVVFRYYKLDYDHRDSSKKEFCVSELVTSGKKKLLAEITKCDLICANFHRERTYQRSINPI